MKTGECIKETRIDRKSADGTLMEVKNSHVDVFVVRVMNGLLEPV